MLIVTPYKYRLVVGLGTPIPSPTVTAFFFAFKIKTNISVFFTKIKDFSKRILIFLFHFQNCHHFLF